MEDSGPRLNLPAIIKKLVDSDSPSPVKPPQPVFPYLQKFSSKKSETHIYDRLQPHHHVQTLRPQLLRRTSFLTEKPAVPAAPATVLLAVPLAVPSRKRRISKRNTLSFMRNTIC